MLQVVEVEESSDEESSDEEAAAAPIVTNGKKVKPALHNGTVTSARVF